MLVKGIKIFQKKNINKKSKHDCEQYRNLPEDEKHRLAEYRKNYFKMQKIKADWLFY